MCIKCEFLFTNFQDAKLHQEIEHYETNIYIRSQLIKSY